MAIISYNVLKDYDNKYHESNNLFKNILSKLKKRTSSKMTDEDSYNFVDNEMKLF